MAIHSTYVESCRALCAVVGCTPFNGARGPVFVGKPRGHCVARQQGHTCLFLARESITLARGILDLDIFTISLFIVASCS